MKVVIVKLIGVMPENDLKQLKEELADAFNTKKSRIIIMMECNQNDILVFDL